MLEFRRSGPGDVDSLVDLRIEFMRVVKDGGLPDEAEWRAYLASRFARDLASGDLTAWVCLDDGRLVATSGLAFPADPVDRGELGIGPGEALVFNMYTIPAYRRRGLARELLLRCVASARELGASSLRLQPTDEGRPLYASMGFEDSGEDMTLTLYLVSRSF